MGDNKTTKVSTSVIVREYPIGAGVDDPPSGFVSGNIKALIPLSRELLDLEPIPENPQQMKYRRGKIERLREKRIFGVLSKF